ncbi:MAG: hypothetical protein HRT44_03885 [Bdellovibrionales bacterium]|nr:hypothetical protein [Bdellovibrionales bacterium]NQZ18384.1 hypothetical protein [Bdellovibrionales bacterium]
MDYKNQAWFTELGLNDDIFQALPQGDNPLVWALKNEHISMEKYTLWAREHYQLPHIKDSFFNFSMDASLPEKYQGLYSWSPSCYPIYEWEDVLYVACLEPVSLNEDQKACFVIASLSSMETAWNKFQTTNKETNEAKNSVIITPPAPAEEESHQESENVILAPPVPEADDNQESVIITPPAPEEEESIVLAPPVSEEKASTAPAAPVPDLDFSNLSMDAEGEGFEAHPPVEAPVIEKKEVAPKTQSPEREETLGGLSFADLNMSGDQPMDQQDEEEEEFDDDITPPPVEATPTPSTQSVSFDQITQTQTQTKTEEMTKTDVSSPIYIPKDKRITDEDLKKHTDLDLCQGTKDVISHIFGHLTRDYNKLMWLELSETGQFFPRFVYGPWPLDSTAWNHALDVSKPNIFRIAFKSSLPFHGEVSSNKVNDQYFDWWNGGEKPDMATVYPLIFDEACFGFLLGFDQGPEFDFVRSLKKMEDLISLSSKAFEQINSMKKAG